MSPCPGCGNYREHFIRRKTIAVAQIEQFLPRGMTGCSNSHNLDVITLYEPKHRTIASFPTICSRSELTKQGYNFIKQAVIKVTVQKCGRNMRGVNSDNECIHILCWKLLFHLNDSGSKTRLKWNCAVICKGVYIAYISCTEWFNDLFCFVLFVCVFCCNALKAFWLFYYLSF